MSVSSEITDSVKKYYGEKLQTSDDLQTTACTTPAQRMPKHILESIKLVHDEVVSKYYGCGLVVPECLEGMKVLDLGSGSGRDCYAIAKLVGSNGFVTGIDMTDEQLKVANKYIDYHQKLFKYPEPNTTFVKGYIENLKDAGIGDESIDIIVSNCVINLCKDKKRVLEEAYRVLKYGGELYFSDVYADQELSDEIRQHEVLWGECVSGALHWQTLYNLAKEIGFEVPRVVTCSSLEITKPDLKEVVGDARFASVVYRLFKTHKDSNREITQVVYNGSITGCENEFKLDRHTTFPEGKPVIVSGRTLAILQNSRFKEDFLYKSAPCCATVAEIKEEDPFVILASADSKKLNNGAQCCGSKCC
uniref:Arsenite methyltransferase n=1 Tax=Phallusia mammillata TaxID=59560 RepID=A0A6F9D6D2_9ASCI|nr:arsenite methyltransferase-like [Phallusia mammillata]